MSRPLVRPEPLAAPRAVLRLKDRSARFGNPMGPSHALLFVVVFGGVGAAMVGSALGFIGDVMPPDAPRGILLAFGSLMLGCGLGFGLRAAQQVARARRAERMRSEYPDQPWRWERTWHPEVKDDGAAELVRGFLVPAGFGLFLLPFHWIGLTQEGAGIMLASAILFDLVLLVFLGKAVYLALRYMRLGTSRLTLQRMPCFLGETLEATLTPARPIPGVQSLELTVRCVEERTEVQRRGNKSHTVVVPYALHTQLLTVDAASLAEGRPLPFSLPLPGDVPELTTCLTAEAPRYWELEARAARPGVDYRAVFLVPVY